MTTSKELDKSFDSLTATALKVKSDRDTLLEACLAARELIDGYLDVEDGEYGVPRPNKAMCAAQLLDDAIALAESR